MKPALLIAGLVGTIAAVGAASAIFTTRTARRVEAEVPPRGRFVDVGNARLHVVEQGAGPPLVLIHGLGGQLQHFTHSLFERLTGDFRLIAIDRPGAGYSTRRDDDSARLAEQARAIHTFIATQKIEKPLLVGHSLGGSVALRLALDYPGSISGLVLLSPLTRRQEVPRSFQGLAIESSRMRKLVAWTLATPMGILGGHKVLEMIFAPQRPPADFATRGGGLLSLRPSGFYTTSLDLVSVNRDLPAMEGRYGELSMPVGVLYGTADNLLDPQRNVHALASRLPSLDVEYIEGLGHMLPLSRPDAVATFIRRMAAKCLTDDSAAINDSA